MITPATKRSVLDLMLGAALLEPDIYQEAAMSPSVRVQALLVVLISSLAVGLAKVGGGPAGLLLGTLAGLLGWALCTAVAYRIAITRLAVPHSLTTLNATLRALALASSPRVFLVFTFLPGIGLLLGLAVHAWVLITTVFAIAITMDLDTRPAVLAAVGGWLPMLLVWLLAALLV